MSSTTETVKVTWVPSTQFEQQTWDWLGQRKSHKTHQITICHKTQLLVKRRIPLTKSYYSMYRSAEADFKINTDRIELISRNLNIVARRQIYVVGLVRQRGQPRKNLHSIFRRIVSILFETKDWKFSKWCSSLAIFDAKLYSTRHTNNKNSLKFDASYLWQGMGIIQRDPTGHFLREVI